MYIGDRATKSRHGGASFRPGQRLEGYPGSMAIVWQTGSTTTTTTTSPWVGQLRPGDLLVYTGQSSSANTLQLAGWEPAGPIRAPELTDEEKRYLRESLGLEEDTDL